MLKKVANPAQENLSKREHLGGIISPIVAAVLTEKQRDVARLLLCGFPREAVAKTLHVTEACVKSRERALCFRFGLGELNRVRLAIALMARS